MAVPIWLLATTSVALAPDSGWSLGLVLACLASSAVAYAHFVIRRVPWILVAVLSVVGLVLALTSPPSLDMSGGSVVSTWASLLSLTSGALVVGRWGPVAALGGGVVPLALARLRQGALETVGDPSRWLEVATFAVFAGMVTASVVSILRRTAAQADEVAVRRARGSAAASRAEAGRAELRRVGRILHDTVVNTLCAIHRWTATGRAAVAARCAADLAFLRSVEGAGDAVPEDLLESARARAGLLGLTLDVSPMSGEPLGPALDPRTYLALQGACWEALNNVARHSGVDHARLTWSWDGASGQLEVADSGVGFRAEGGWSGGAAESVAARCAEAGVSADVASAPGSGTVVTLAWRVEAADPDDADDSRPGPAIRGELEALRAASALGVSAVVGGIGLIATILWPADLSRWGSLAALGIIGVVALLAWRVRLGSPMPAIPVLVFPVAQVAATVLPALGRQDSPSGGLWWWGPPACLGVAVGAFMLDRRRSVVPAVVVGCVVAVVLGAGQVGPGPGSQRPDQLSILILDLGGIAALVAYRRRLAETWSAGRRDQDRMSQAAAQRVRALEEARVRSHLLSVARNVAEPLLAGIAAGELDPLDPVVRSRCGQAEGTLRALSVVPASPSGGIGNLLAETVVAAPGHGVDLGLRLGPDAPLPPDDAVADVRRVLGSVVDACPPSGTAQITLLRIGPTAKMLVLGDIAEGDAVAELREAVEAATCGQWELQTLGDQVLCEASWPVSDELDELPASTAADGVALV